MVCGYQLQVAKLAQMCPAAPSGDPSQNLGQKLNPGHPTVLNCANQCFFRAHHPFYFLFEILKIRRVKTFNSQLVWARNLQSQSINIGKHV